MRELDTDRTSKATIERVDSADGVSIGFSRMGHGPLLIIVDGALHYREIGLSHALAKKLASHFTVVTYDRRGRGQSGDAYTHRINEEIADLDALIIALGGNPFVCGLSSGAILALEAARRITSISKLALHEPPFIVSGCRPSTTADWELIFASCVNGNSDDAVRTFLNSSGMLPLATWVLGSTPTWRKLTRVARTLLYDGDIVRQYQLGCELPTDRWTSVTVPILVTAGGRSPDWIVEGGKALVSVVANGTFKSIPRGTEILDPKRLAPELITFFGGAC